MTALRRARSASPSQRTNQPASRSSDAARWPSSPALSAVAGEARLHQDLSALPVKSASERLSSALSPDSLVSRVSGPDRCPAGPGPAHGSGGRRPTRSPARRRWLCPGGLSVEGDDRLAFQRRLDEVAGVLPGLARRSRRGTACRRGGPGRGGTGRRSPAASRCARPRVLARVVAAVVAFGGLEAVRVSKMSLAMSPSVVSDHSLTSSLRFIRHETSWPHTRSDDAVVPRSR